jgi:S-formylglutathione hydrolase
VFIQDRSYTLAYWYQNMVAFHQVALAETPGPIEYALLRPTGDELASLPLLYVLHGGGASRTYLERVAPAIEQGWAEGWLPPFIAVTPTMPPYAMYMNLLDGSERWEDALCQGLLRHLQAAHGVSAQLLLCGPSLGGAASLRLAFKHPQLFRGVAALAPGIQPAFELDAVDPSDVFWRGHISMERAFGAPMNAAYWRANNPAALARDHAATLRDSGLAIYLECGDQDSFGLHRGAEFLHRVLFDDGVSHEYRLVRNADHVGATLPARFRDALGFLAKVIAPPPPDPDLALFHAQLARMKAAT